MDHGDRDTRQAMPLDSVFRQAVEFGHGPSYYDLALLRYYDIVILVKRGPTWLPPRGCGAQPRSAAARTASRIAASPALASATSRSSADSTLASTGAKSAVAASWAAMPASVSWIRYERASPGLGARRA